MTKTEIEILNKYFPDGIKCEDDKVGIIRAMSEYASQFQSTPKWIRTDAGNLPKKIRGTIFRQISTKIILSENMAKDWIEDQDFNDLEWLDETPGNVSPVADALTIEDYKEVIKSHNESVRELDVLINGKAGAAKQASLIDIIAQIKDMKLSPVVKEEENKTTFKKMDMELDLVHECLTELYNIDAAVPIIKECLSKIEKL